MSAEMQTATAPRQPSEPLTLDTAFVIWSRKRGAYWGPNANGYTKSLLKAGIYTEKAAREIERESVYGPEHLRSEAIHLASHVTAENLTIRPGTVLWLITMRTA